MFIIVSIESTPHIRFSMGNNMISSAIWCNKHELIFSKISKLHKHVRQVQFCSLYKFLLHQIVLEIILLPVNN